MEFSALLQERRCVRAYEKYAISKEEVLALLEAGTAAPNACNYQSWHFYATVDEQIKARFQDEAVARIPWVKDTALVIVVCTKDEVTQTLEDRFGARGGMFTIQDTAGAINHILLKAADMGLGGCWIGPMDVSKCKELMQIAPGHTPVAILSIGKPASDVPKRPRQPLAEVVTMVGEL